MPKRVSPRKGSMQYWPRKRAKRVYTRVRAWRGSGASSPGVSRQTVHGQAGVNIFGFSGYKAGMIRILAKDSSTSITKGMDVVYPATVIECPPLKVFKLRYYKNCEDGARVIGEELIGNPEKQLKRKITLPKKGADKTEDKNKDKTEDKNKDADKSNDANPNKISGYDFAMLQVYTQPTWKKKPEIFEIAVSREYVEDIKKLKEIRLSDVFKEGQLIDIHAVTTGKGFQGAVKRFGVHIRSHKAEKTKRGAGSLGAWHTRQMWTVPYAGQMGFHSRTEYNKLIIKIGNKPGDINPKGGFKHYGLVKNDYIILKGSIPGPAKRIIRFIHAIRPNKRLMQVMAIKKIIT